AADDAVLAGDIERQRYVFASEGVRAEHHHRVLAFVVEDHIEETVAVQIDEADGLCVEDSLLESDLRRGVFKRAVALVAEEAVAAFEATDDQIEMAVVVNIAPGSAGGPGVQVRQVAGLRGHVDELALAVVLVEQRLALLRHE